MDIRSFTSDDVLLGVILYGCLPLWVLMGFADYLCHRRTAIERTTGLRESVLHVVMGAQIGLPVFLGLYFEINVLLLLIALGLLVIHEWVAHRDVVLALENRRISIWEMHVHSFLEALPFAVVALLMIRRWPAFVDLITFNWTGQLTLVPKETPIGFEYIVAYFSLMMALGVLPYLEEAWRCYRYQQGLAIASGKATSHD